jgi:hypothetical protein
MAVILVPKPSPKAMNPNRLVNALLLAQVEHLQHAERRLPLRYRTEIYTHAIRTEGEAARYIREVTEAIFAAHRDALTGGRRTASGGTSIAQTSVGSTERKRDPQREGKLRSRSKSKTKN